MFNVCVVVAVVVVVCSILKDVQYIIFFVSLILCRHVQCSNVEAKLKIKTENRHFKMTCGN